MCYNYFSKWLRLFMVCMCVALLFPSQSRSEEINFKGVPIGTPGVSETLATMCSKEHSSQNEDDGVRKQKNCQFGEGLNTVVVTYGNLANVPALIMVDKNMAIEEVVIVEASERIVVLAKLLEAKYGKPSIQHRELINGFGVRYENNRYIWVDERGSAIVVDQRRGKQLNLGEVRMYSSSKFKQLQVEASKEFNKGLSNL